MKTELHKGLFRGKLCASLHSLRNDIKIFLELLYDNKVSIKKY